MKRRRVISASASCLVSSRVLRCSRSVVSQKMITPQQAASTAMPWMADQTQGLVCPAGWVKIRSVRSADPRPWLSTVKTTFHRNGTQSWYRAMKPIMMKKWKWASIEPPEKLTSTAEQ